MLMRPVVGMGTGRGSLVPAVGRILLGSPRCMDTPRHTVPQDAGIPPAHTGPQDTWEPQGAQTPECRGPLWHTLPKDQGLGGMWTPGHVVTPRLWLPRAVLGVRQPQPLQRFPLLPACYCHAGAHPPWEEEPWEPALKWGRERALSSSTPQPSRRVAAGHWAGPARRQRGHQGPGGQVVGTPHPQSLCIPSASLLDTTRVLVGHDRDSGAVWVLRGAPGLR